MTDHDESGSVWSWRSAVDDSIAGLAPTERVPRNRGLARLAIAYADTLDANDGDPEVLLDFGPKLQSALIALGCAPVKTATSAKPGSGGESSGDGRATLTLLQGQWGKSAG